MIVFVACNLMVILYPAGRCIYARIITVDRYRTNWLTITCIHTDARVAFCRPWDFIKRVHRGAAALCL